MVLGLNNNFNIVKTQEYYEHEINENKQIKFIFITNMKMKKFDNLITM